MNSHELGKKIKLPLTLRDCETYRGTYDDASRIQDVILESLQSTIFGLSAMCRAPNGMIIV